jgi:hypothetical protein
MQVVSPIDIVRTNPVYVALPQKRVNGPSQKSIRNGCSEEHSGTEPFSDTVAH